MTTATTKDRGMREVLEDIPSQELVEAIRRLEIPKDVHVRVTIEIETAKQQPDEIGLRFLKEALEEAAGMWKDRKGIVEEMEGIRKEADRSFCEKK